MEAIICNFKIDKKNIKEIGATNTTLCSTLIEGFLPTMIVTGQNAFLSTR